MDPALVVSLLISLFTLCAGLIGTLVGFLVPIVVTGVVVWVVLRALSTSQAKQLQAAPAAVVARQAAGKPRVKKVVCGQCGGSKVIPPKTAYVYCDFCGSLVDWDFQIACKTAGSAKPGPLYEQLQAVELPKQQAAKAAGDRAAYEESTKRVFDAHFTHAKGSWSPRLGDPAYRAALLDNTAKHYTAAAFDPECVHLEAAMTDAVKRLQWVPAFPQPRVARPGFDALLAAVLAHNERFIACGLPFLDEHPDAPTADLQRRIARSAFAQGWMAFLDPPGKDAMIAALGLGGDYVDVPDTALTERHCGGCARTLRIAPGAKKVVCEDCGHTNDVAHPEVTCSGCGGPVSLLWHQRSFRCPSCSMELRVDG